MEEPTKPETINSKRCPSGRKTYAIKEFAKEQIRYIHREGNTKSVIIYDNLITIFVQYFK